MIIFWELLGLFILLALAAFFSASETALLSLSKIKIKKIIAQKKAPAETLSRWLSHPEYLLTTLLVGATVVGMAISILSADLAISLIGSRSPYRTVVEVITWLVVSFSLLLFGDIAPKIYARELPEEISLFALRPLTLLTRILSPLVHPFVRLLAKVFPVLETAPVAKINAITLEEVQHVVQELRARGAVAPDSGEILERVLRLGDLQVSQIMIPLDQVDLVDWKVAEGNPMLFIQLVIEAGRTRVPIRRQNSLAGYVHVKDLLSVVQKVHAGRLDAKMIQAMIRPLVQITLVERVSQLLERFRHGTHIAVIQDGEGLDWGIVTLDDVLEEVIGEILDEYELEESLGPGREP